jgi:GWxTD domain-containing protein
MAGMSLAEEKAFLLILAPDEKKDFQKLHAPADKVRWAQIYWKKRDPTPTTEKNEQHEEFQRRVEYARKWYRALFDEGFDDRGRIYVKYGEPSDKYVQPMGEIYVRPNESWSYSHIAKGLVFDFVDRGGHYKLVNDLGAAMGTTGDLAKRLYDLAQLYENRSYLDDSYIAIANELNRHLNAGRFSLAQKEFEATASRNQLVRQQAPAVVLIHRHRAKPLPVALSLARFDQGDSVRTEIYYGVPYNHLRFVEHEARWQAALRGEIAIFDEAYQLLASDSVRAVCTAPTEAAKQSGAYISQFNFTLPAGQYHLALHLENVAGPDSAVGIMRSDFSAPGFAGGGLRMSDIQLSPNIRATERATRFVKHGLEIMPLPGLSIQKQRPLHVYFEIYNLTMSAQGETNYEIEYSVKQGSKAGLLAAITGAASDKKKSVTLQERRTGKNAHPFEHIAFDLSALEAGKWELTVTVKDLVASQQAMATVPLRLEEEKQ